MMLTLAAALLQWRGGERLRLRRRRREHGSV